MDPRLVIQLRWLACSVALLGCSSSSSAPRSRRDDTGRADASAFDAGARADAARLVSEDAMLVSEDAMTARDPARLLDASVTERALDQLVRARVVVNQSQVCALNAARDVVCWGSRIGGSDNNGVPNREDHASLTGPFVELDMQEGELFGSAVCGLHDDAGVECKAWDGSQDLFTDFARWTRDDHDVAFSLDRNYANYLIVIDTDGGVSAVVDGVGHRPSLNTGRRAVQLQQSKNYLCVRDEVGHVQCTYSPDDGGVDVVQEAPADIYRDISVGEFAACGITTQGRVRCWDMFVGEDLMKDGFASTISSLPATPRQLSSETGSAGTDVCTLLTDNRVYCGWYTQFAPTELDLGLGASESIVEFAAGQEAVCFALADDTLRCLPDPKHCTPDCANMVERYRVPEGFVLAPR